MREAVSDFRKWIAALFLVAGSPVLASGGAGKYVLDWPVRGERLVYYSCGCADDCWVAEVLARRTGVVRARLRCDCERLYFTSPGRAPEQEIASSCENFNRNGKFDAIPEKLRELIAAGKKR